MENHEFFWISLNYLVKCTFLKFCRPLKLGSELLIKDIKNSVVIIIITTTIIIM